MGNKTLTAKELQEAIAAAAGDPEKLAAIAANAVNSLQTQESNVETANQVINELQEANEAQKKADPNYRPEVKVKGGDTYRVLHGITVISEVGTKVLSVDDIAGDQKLLKQLGDGDSTAVVKLPKE